MKQIIYIIVCWCVCSSNLVGQKNFSSSITNKGRWSVSFVYTIEFLDNNRFTITTTVTANPCLEIYNVLKGNYTRHLQSILFTYDDCQTRIGSTKMSPCKINEKNFISTASYNFITGTISNPQTGSGALFADKIDESIYEINQKSTIDMWKACAGIAILEWLEK